jgi:hypothetical protein
LCTKSVLASSGEREGEHQSFAMNTIFCHRIFFL